MKFLEAVEQRIFDSSRGNMLVHTLNVVKSGCLIIEMLMKVRHQFPFVSRRVNEIKNQIIHICV